jgi:hypothetical protein
MSTELGNSTIAIRADVTHRDSIVAAADALLRVGGRFPQAARRSVTFAGAPQALRDAQAYGSRRASTGREPLTEAVLGQAGEGTRTPDLPLTRRLLYQLSYSGALR